MNTTASNAQVNSVSGKKLPRSLIEAVRYFSDPQVCIDYIARLRWPDGPVCPQCEGRDYSYLTSRRLWKCKGCKRQFSVKQGTIFEASPIGLDKWLPAVWMLANSKNGVSSHELARALGITQKSAWHLDHRIREAMRVGTFERFSGEVEIDETFVGGKARNKKNHQRAERARRTSTVGVSPFEGKTVIVGAKDRNDGRVTASVIPDRNKHTLVPYVRETVTPGSRVYTDALGSYRSLPEHGYDHEWIDHVDTYVEGRVHTNGIENFWALLKRGLHGTYVAVNPEHLFRYVDERVFTYNERELSDLERFELVLRQSIGRRMTWEELTN